MHQNCCVASGPRALALLPQLAVMQADEGPVVNLYGRATARAATPSGASVALAIDTDYPAGDTVAIRIDPERPEEFALRLRVPGWSVRTQLTVNGEPRPVEPGRYAVVRRAWKPGDAVLLKLDLRTRAIPAPGAPSFQALVRGPLVLALDRRITRDLDGDTAGLQPKADAERRRRRSIRTRRRRDPAGLRRAVPVRRGPRDDAAPVRLRLGRPDVVEGLEAPGLAPARPRRSRPVRRRPRRAGAGLSDFHGMNHTIAALAAVALAAVVPASAASGGDWPQVTRVDAAAPDVLHVVVRTGEVVRGQQAPYVRARGHRRALDRRRDRDAERARDRRSRRGRDAPLPLRARRAGRVHPERWRRAARVRLRSPDDPEFRGGQPPQSVDLKTRPYEVSRVAGWEFEAPLEHHFYFRFAKPLRDGARYELTVNDGSPAIPAYTHSPRTTRSEAVHVSQVGFRPDDPPRWPSSPPRPGREAACATPRALPSS
ncbi:MAG: glycoside hydrolase family 127 protein [Desulfomicrobium escambiense]|nr:glycoside hydrolase family 127 protein [Desulfomicrobium escambiense]